MMKNRTIRRSFVLFLGLLLAGLAGPGCNAPASRDESRGDLRPAPAGEIPTTSSLPNPDLGLPLEESISDQLDGEGQVGTAMEEEPGLESMELEEGVEVILPEELEEVEFDPETEKSLAPFVPTPQEVVKAMLEIAGVKSDDVVYDLGCGDGRILITASRDFGARSVGVELDKERCEGTAKRIKELGLSHRITVKHGDLLEEDLSPATVVFIYLMPEANEKLKGRLKKFLKPGSRVVSHDFPIEDWETSVEKRLKVEEDGFDHTIYLYRM